MKFKFTALLLLALSMSGTSVLTSCKDYDEDQYNEVRTTLKDLYEEQKQELKNQVARLEAELAKINSCECDPAEVDRKIADALAQYDGEIKDFVKNYLKENKYLTESEINSLVNLALQDYCKKSDCLTEDNVKALIKQYCEGDENKAFIRGLIDAAIENLATKSELNAAVEDLKQVIKDGDNAVLGELSSTKEELLQKIATAQQAAEAAQATANANGISIDSIKNAISILPQLTQDVANVIAKANTNAEKIETLQNLYNELKNEFNNYYTKAEVDALIETNVNDLTQKINQAKDDAKAYADGLVEIVNTRIDGVDTRITDLQTACEEADQQLANSIEALKGDIADLNSAIEALETRLANAENAIKKLITGIIPQATKNAVCGTFAAPIGISSNILIAYYGEADNAIQFPTTMTGNYVYPENALTSTEWEMLGLTPSSVFKAQGGSKLISDAADNAGTLYVTINPNNVDFEGQTLQLVNSQDEESAIKLGALVKSDNVQTFGYTRAANNGYYEAPAYLDPEKIDEVKFDIHPELMKTAANLVKKHNGAATADFLMELYNQFNGTLPANAVKASWNDEVAGERSVVSKYEIAATAIKPLGFGVGKQIKDIVTVPGYEVAENLIDRVANAIKTRINRYWPDFDELDTNDIVIKHVTYDPSAFGKVKVTFTITATGTHTEVIGNAIVGKNSKGQIVQKIDFTGTGIEIKDNGDKTYTVSYERDMQEEAKPIFDAIDEAFGDVNETYDSLEDFLADANALLDEINNYREKLENGTDNAKNILISYLDKYHNKLRNTLNRAKNFFQPALVVTGDATGTKILSRSKNYPTKVKESGLTLYPTTYSAEIISPIFKKHIACVNAFRGDKSAQGGNQACINALNAFNSGDLNKVLEGKTFTVPAMVKKGYVYEIAYSALDYSGQIVTRRYYIKY